MCDFLLLAHRCCVFNKKWLWARNQCDNRYHLFISLSLSWFNPKFNNSHRITLPSHTVKMYFVFLIYETKIICHWYFKCDFKFHISTHTRTNLSNSFCTHTIFFRFEFDYCCWHYWKLSNCHYGLSFVIHQFSIGQTFMSNTFWLKIDENNVKENNKTMRFPIRRASITEASWQKKRRVEYKITTLGMGNKLCCVVRWQRRCFCVFVFVYVYMFISLQRIIVPWHENTTIFVSFNIEKREDKNYLWIVFVIVCCDFISFVCKDIK